MILVSGAAGKTGLAVIRALVARGEAVRALVHRFEQVESVQDAGVQEIVVGDMRKRGKIELAVRGVRAVYHICPNVSPDELAIGRLGISAANAAGVNHFVYHSVLHPQVEAMPHHWLKMRVEEQLFRSGLEYTILQPAPYMQNVLAQWKQILRGVYPVPYLPETRLGMVDLQDVAEVAAIVLTEAGHAGAVYELAGEVLSQTKVAAILSLQLGRLIRAKVVPLNVWEQRARAAGLGDYQVETLLAMFRYYEHYGFRGNSRVLGWLLGREATTFADFVERVARES